MEIVNLEEAKREFIEFVDKYDLTMENIKLKKYHSLRVMEVAAKIAKKENFNAEEIEIATLIGLLHDIARFKQYTEYKTFKDAESFDHGDEAVKILEKDNYLRKFIQNDKYDEIIKLAIKNHNKFVIEDGITEEQNKFCKIIRDADKLDIFYIAAEILWQGQEEKMESSIMNPEIRETINKKILMENSKYKKISYVDSIIKILGFIFDINFKSSFEILKDEKYVDRIVNRFKFKDEYTQREILEIGKQMNQYILSKI